MYSSKQIMVGKLPLGGNAPVRLQSMTNTNTLDIKASVDQVIRIIEAGADMVRLAIQGEKEAEALAIIKKEIWKAGFDTPLIADVHFNPAIAEFAAGIVAKVRINPGNYVDKRAIFSNTELSEKEYQEELERIHSRLLPLINKCISNDTAIRVGVNHGSLSDRIMTRYGNTPYGMAVSAMEFIRIFKAENFHKLILSMKSSNSLLMIEATGLLVEMMQKEKLAYPLHLGVTEAGEGEDGRIKSALGIGALLRRGIGDTIRVSLSEPPENEIPVARSIIKHATSFRDEPPANDIRNISDKNTLHLDYSTTDEEELMIKSTVESSLPLIEKQANDLIINNKGSIPKNRVQSITDGILQAARIKISRNDYISCPTCGRTKYDLADSVAKVKAATSHLKGLKIAIMGCIVNGPGEMADADYGYVGGANGKVNLYKGKTVILKNIPEDQAVAELLKIIEKDNL